jgi:hypothetical protein
VNCGRNNAAKREREVKAAEITAKANRKVANEQAKLLKA